MTTLFNDPAEFTGDTLRGFVDLYSNRVIAVPGGVIRADSPKSGKVAVIVGGGSGHYPAFCGLVGPGFADGAVVGNIFTSPSVADVMSVARAAHAGGGVLLSAGNYAGDLMNFSLAAERLVLEGIDTRVLLVTDDIASAPVGSEDRRRGIAGDFVVFKIASAAAEEGATLDQVVEIATRANRATRSLGVAFDGCVMPGAPTPLFTVPTGQMSIGLGIHGEPGVRDTAQTSAQELARTLVREILAELPAAGERHVAAVLNGLGRTKYEELFVVWSTVAPLIREAGLELVEPEVGELVTSLDMAGCSLTITALDDELERLWRAPASSPAYCKGSGAAPTERRRVGVATRDEPTRPRPSSTASREAARIVLRGLEAATEAVADAEAELGRIDAVAGDGDHGRGMVRGTTAALDAARLAVADGAGVHDVLAAAGRAWADRAGGTSGVLWGAALEAAASIVGDSALDDAAVARAASAAVDAIQRTGGAVVGDKTLLDALVPFSRTLEGLIASGRSLTAAWQSAAYAADAGAKSSAHLTPRVGRARPLAERSIGTPDAGATSMALMAAAVLPVVEGTQADSTKKEGSVG